MFRQAIALARQFTLPVVLSRKTVAGVCSSGIGTFVVVNRDGWIITAGHILDQMDKLIQGEQAMRAYEMQRAAIEADTSLGSNERKRRIAALGKVNKNATDRCSAWWGRDGVKVVDAVRIPSVDIGIGRLEPFDPSWFSAYPVFKDPAKNFEAGASLCTFGFPFHSITPVWDGTALAFRLPNGALPMPFFPMDGIFTRVAALVVVDEKTMQPVAQPPFPLRWIETSHPGLRGQSGGPIVDPEGSIWGIQCNTVSYPLGFDPPVPGRPGVTQHQFLNIGRGVHPDTIFGFLNEFSVKYDVTSY